MQSLPGKPFCQNLAVVFVGFDCFEQSYGGVDGDSASSTEYYCLLSAIADLPIKQNIAVTGSINQFGDIQPIGGVNEKIGGFFDVCNHRGLTGDQGVIIPRTNVVDLMLREDVITAVREGKFHIYAIDTVDDGIEILTGLKAGKPNANGEYPKGTVNYLVKQKSAQISAALLHVCQRCVRQCWSLISEYKKHPPIFGGVFVCVRLIYQL